MNISNTFEPGMVAIIPTDTVYGLVAVASDQSAVTRLYGLKHREAKPGTLVAASIEQLTALGVHRRYLTAVADFWPNPLTVVIPVGAELDYLTQGVRSLAMRIPADESFRELLERTGPLLTSSANLPGEPTANTVDMARDYFGDSVDFYVDGGDLSGNKPSTIIRIVDDAIEILRPGAVQINEQGRITP